MIKLLLVDDHKMLCDCLCEKLEESGDIQVVASACNVSELMTALSTTTPEIILLDVTLPDGNGLALIPRLKNAYPAIKIILLTMHDHVRYVVQALENGADGYVVKGAPLQELIEGIHRVAQNESFVCKILSAKIAGYLKGGNLKKKTLMDSLSSREFEVFLLLSQGISIKKAAKQMGVSEKSISTYRTRLLEKMHVTSNVELARLAREADLLE